ncbi:FixH family protein [Paenibacillus puldeungensis]|uniref:FixH family protein n=1 Tax=Paenibacillus puldeungensis TaxID=696536 RepID=A0ABW3RU41_9BACL
MKGKGWLIWTLSLLIILLSGCGRAETTAIEDMQLEPIQVELQVTPDGAKTEDKVTFTAKVTQSGEDVNDAAEVMFEFWKTGDDEAEHSKVTVKGTGKGTYVLEHTFNEPGTYKVISHVTARDQHSMPSKQFTVK